VTDRANGLRSRTLDDTRHTSSPTLQRAPAKLPQLQQGSITRTMLALGCRTRIAHSMANKAKRRINTVRFAFYRGGRGHLGKRYDKRRPARTNTAFHDRIEQVLEMHPCDATEMKR
jgi:hypothetical protein